MVWDRCGLAPIHAPTPRDAPPRQEHDVTARCRPKARSAQSCFVRSSRRLSRIRKGNRAPSFPLRLGIGPSEQGVHPTMMPIT
jgi:hypothetical protein